MPEAICKLCGNSFVTKRGKYRYCSSECTQKSRSNYIKEYQQNNQERIKEISKEYRLKNINKIKDYAKSYIEKNRETIQQQQTDYKRKKRQSDFLFKLKDNTRRRLNKALKSQNAYKSQKTMDILGCSIEEYREYLENLFLPDMTWDNHGEWHIDHKTPIASFNLSNEEELKKAFHYTNTQPLWAEDNLRKSNK